MPGIDDLSGLSRGQSADGGCSADAAPPREPPAREEVARFRSALRCTGEGAERSGRADRAGGSAEAGGFSDLFRFPKARPAAGGRETEAEAGKGTALDDGLEAPLSREELARLAAQSAMSAFGASREAASALGAERTAAPASAQSAQAAPPSAAMEALVSRILVSSPQAGSAEVRLTLAGDALKGTEVSITRDLDGRLAVKLSAADPSAMQTLVAGRDDLARMLSAGERMPVDIQIEAERQRSSEDGRSQGGDERKRRSREDNAEEIDIQ